MSPTLSDRLPPGTYLEITVEVGDRSRRRHFPKLTWNDGSLKFPGGRADIIEETEERGNLCKRVLETIYPYIDFGSEERSRMQTFRSVGKGSATSWEVSRISFLGIIATRNDCSRNSWMESMPRGVVGIGLSLPAMISHGLRVGARALFTPDQRRK
jgi:hypothetical protein